MTDLVPPTIPGRPQGGAGRVGRMRTDGNGRYRDGVRSWQRTTNLLKNVETDTHALDEWKANMLAYGLSQREDLVLGVAAAAQFNEHGKLTDEAKETLRGLRKQAMEAARSKHGQNQGNAVHTATERYDMGESLDSIGLPAPYNADLFAYAQLKKALGLSFRPEHIERTVRNTPLDNCGTFDRIGTSTWLIDRGLLAADELLVVDVKTEGAPLYNLMHIAPQLANYATADGLFVPAPTSENEYAGHYEPMPKINQKYGLIIHVRDGRAVPYLVNLEAGYISAARALEQRDQMKASKTKLGEEGCWAVPVPVELPPATNLTADALARGPLGFSAPAGTTPAAYREEVAMQRPDGNVEWVASGPAPVSVALDEPDRQAIEVIWMATDLAALGRVYEIYTQTLGREWGGRVAEAGAARQRQIECPQRALHAGNGRCACGWTDRLPA